MKKLLMTVTYITTGVSENIVISSYLKRGVTRAVEQIYGFGLKAFTHLENSGVDQL